MSTIVKTLTEQAERARAAAAAKHASAEAALAKLAYAAAFADDLTDEQKEQLDNALTEAGHGPEYAAQLIADAMKLKDLLESIAAAGQKRTEFLEVHAKFNERFIELHEKAARARACRLLAIARYPQDQNAVQASRPDEDDLSTRLGKLDIERGEAIQPIKAAFRGMASSLADVKAIAARRPTLVKHFAEAIADAEKLVADVEASRRTGGWSPMSPVSKPVPVPPTIPGGDAFIKRISNTK